MLYIFIAFIVGIGFVLAPMLTPMMFLIAGPVLVIMIVLLVVHYRRKHDIEKEPATVLGRKGES
jgi:hypothetical protein